MSVTELAGSLGFTHTAINKFSMELVKHELLSVSCDPCDKRRRLLELSPKGKSTVETLLPVWDDIRTVVENLLLASEPNLLTAIAGVERQLDKAEMYTRVRAQLRPRLMADIEVLPYRPHLKKHFRRLNSECLADRFQLEEADDRQLKDPNGQIIKKGGLVFFASIGGEIVGTAALLKHKNGVYELAKMAVDGEHRNRFIGTRLTQHIIVHVKNLGIAELYLETHPSMTQAIHFYGKHGFERIDGSDLPVKYDRDRVVMRALV